MGRLPSAAMDSKNHHGFRYACYFITLRRGGQIGHRDFGPDRPDEDVTVHFPSSSATGILNSAERRTERWAVLQAQIRPRCRIRALASGK